MASSPIGGGRGVRASYNVEIGSWTSRHAVAKEVRECSECGFQIAYGDYLRKVWRHYPTNPRTPTALHVTWQHECCPEHNRS